MRYLVCSLLFLATVGCGKKPVDESEPGVQSEQPTPSLPGPETPGKESGWEFDAPTVEEWKKLGFGTGIWTANSFGEIAQLKAEDESASIAAPLLVPNGPLTTLGPKPNRSFALDLREYPYQDATPAALVRSLPTFAADKLVGLGLTIHDPALVSVLKDLPNLRFLSIHLSQDALAAADWSVLAGLSNLKAVDVRLFGSNKLIAVDSKLLNPKTKADDGGLSVKPKKNADSVKLSAFKSLPAGVALSIDASGMFPLPNGYVLSQTALKGLSEVPALASIWLTNPSDEMLEDLAAAPSLRKLHIGGHSGLMMDTINRNPNEIPSQYASIGKMKRLTSLRFVVGQWADAFLTAAVRLPDLTELTLVCRTDRNDPKSRAAPKPETIAKIADLKKLRSLTLKGCKMPKDGFQFLAGLSELSTLDVYNNSTIPELAEVNGLLGRLTNLSVGKNGQDGKTLELIAELKSIRHLRLPLSQLNAAEQSALKRLPYLQSLYFESFHLRDAVTPDLDFRSIMMFPDIRVNGWTPYNKLSQEEQKWIRKQNPNDNLDPNMK